MSRYLVIETAYLGDVIISLCVANAIRQNDRTSEVIYLVRPDAAELARSSPDVDTVLTFDKRDTESGIEGIERKAEQLNAMSIDVVMALHSSKRTKELVRRLTAPVKIGYAPLSEVLTQTVSDSGWSTRYERCLLTLKPLFPNVRIDTLPRIGPSRLASVDIFVEGSDPVVTIAPGTAWASKQWPLVRFSELIVDLAARSAKVIIIGGEGEREFGQKLSAKSASILNLAGSASLLEASYAISRSRLLVSNDSSPAHLAAAVGTEALVVYGPTVPEFGFLPPGASPVQIELWCRPCTAHGSHECPVHTHECMRGISVEEVLRHVEPVLFATTEPF